MERQLVSLFAISLTLTLCLGCGSSAPPKTAEKSPEGHDHAEGEHAHPSEGPHHGHLIELGNEEYHAELTHDDATHTVTIYVLDSAAKKAVPIDAKEVLINLIVEGKPEQFHLVAAPQEGDAVEMSSRFSLADEKLHEALEAKTTTGRLNLTIEGKPYSGNVVHHEHDHKH